MTGAASPRLLAALALVATGLPAHAADPSTYLLQPIVTLGEHEIDFHLGAGSGGRSTPPERAAGLGFGMALSQRWYSEVAVQYQRVGSLATQFDAVEWENIVQLAEQGDWPVDAGVLVEVERPRAEDEGPSLRLGALLQKDWGRFEFNGNLIASRHVHSARFESVQWRYQFQAKYRDTREFEYGVQAFGTPSSSARSWEDYQRQVHRVGPAVMGKFSLENERSLSYNAAILFGTTDHSPDRTFRLQMEYEF